MVRLEQRSSAFFAVQRSADFDALTFCDFSALPPYFQSNFCMILVCRTTSIEEDPTGHRFSARRYAKQAVHYQDQTMLLCAAFRAPLLSVAQLSNAVFDTLDRLPPKISRASSKSGRKTSPHSSCSRRSSGDPRIGSSLPSSRTLAPCKAEPSMAAP